MRNRDEDDLCLFEESAAVSGKAENCLRLKSVAFQSPLKLEAAVYALRMIEGGRWHSQLLQHNRIRDDDVLSLIGLEADDSKGSLITLASLRAISARQLARLEKRLRRRDDALAQNIGKLGRVLKLDSTESAVLRLAVVVTRAEHFGDLFHHTLTSELVLIRAVRWATRNRILGVSRALANSRPLRRSGFFVGHAFSFGSNPLELDSTVVDALLAANFDEEQFLRRLVRHAPASTLSVSDFGHMPDLALASRYITKAAAQREKGVNVLIYGAPGTGKTQFVRALAPDLGLDLYEVPNEDKEGDPLSGRRRFSAYAVCQQLMASRRGKLLLFDEVEDVFGTEEGFFSMFAPSPRVRDPDSLRKSWINETLESNPVPTIWVCNSIRAMDPAFLRRFDLVVEFGMPSTAARRRIIDRYFRSGEISVSCADRLARIEHLSPAQIERAARVVRSLRTVDLATRDREVERVLASSLKAMGHRKPIPATVLPEHYDPAFVNADRDIATLIERLPGTSGARLCLYGPPGTGKTALAHHLGRILDRPVSVKRGSDLLSMWVGQTEELIANAFREAGEANAILLIDEADSFLRDRGGATRSWEVTQVNELLTQMEAFDGIFVASTNLIDTLDAASLRRFDFKVKFDFLNREQRRAMLRRVCSSSDRPATEIALAIAAIDRIEHLTPGDFANVLRQLRLTEEPPTAGRIVELLSAEVAMKPGARQRAIGFTASLARS